MSTTTAKLPPVPSASKLNETKDANNKRPPKPGTTVTDNSSKVVPSFKTKKTKSSGEAKAPNLRGGGSKGKGSTKNKMGRDDTTRRDGGYSEVTSVVELTGDRRSSRVSSRGSSRYSRPGSRAKRKPIKPGPRPDEFIVKQLNGCKHDISSGDCLICRVAAQEFKLVLKQEAIEREEKARIARAAETQALKEMNDNWEELDYLPWYELFEEVTPETKELELAPDTAAALLDTMCIHLAKRPHERQQVLDDTNNLIDEMLTRPPPSDKRMNEAAKVIQGALRLVHARKLLRSVIYANFEKHLDQDTGMFYYLNTHTNEARWEPPLLLGGEEMPTPRTQKRRIMGELRRTRQRGKRIAAARLAMEEEMSVKLARRRRGLGMAKLEIALETLVLEFDHKVFVRLAHASSFDAMGQQAVEQLQTEISDAWTQRGEAWTLDKKMSRQLQLRAQAAASGTARDSLMVLSQSTACKRLMESGARLYANEEAWEHRDAFPLSIVVRHYDPDLNPLFRFRLFFFELGLVAISQYYHHIFLPSVLNKRETLLAVLLEFAEDPLRIRLEAAVGDQEHPFSGYDCFLADVIVILPTDPNDRPHCVLIKLVPYISGKGTASSGCLFDWKLDRDALRGHATRVGTPEEGKSAAAPAWLKLNEATGVVKFVDPVGPHDVRFEMRLRGAEDTSTPARNHMDKAFCRAIVPNNVGTTAVVASSQQTPSAGAPTTTGDAIAVTTIDPSAIAIAPQSS